MKKLKLLMLASLVAGSANAQFFQHVYGMQSQDILESGVNTMPTLPQGHAMAGYTDLNGGSDVMLTGADMNGNVPYNNFYQLATAAGPVNTKARSIVELPPGTIGAWGDYSTTSSTISNSFFYMTINPAGTPGFAVSYSFPFFVAEAEATAMCKSPTSPGTVYMCGFIRHVAGGQRDPVVISINGITGAFNWGREYQLNPVADVPVMDLIESPYPDPTTGSVDIALCGHLTLNGNEDGCFFLLDANTGNLAGPLAVMTYGSTTTNEGFNAIDIALNSYGGSKGFVMGGSGFNPASGTMDAWALKTNTQGNTVHWSTYHDYSPGGVNDDFGNDIIERFNTLGQYEYYLGGSTNNGVFGGQDAVVFKLDFKGNAFGGTDQFTYGGPGDDEARQLDQLNFAGPNNDGLSVYANTANSFPLMGQNDFYLVKAYFNGVTTCQYDLQPYPSYPGPIGVTGYRLRIPSKIGGAGMSIYNYGHMGDWEICFSTMEPAGDNTRHAATVENDIAAPGYFPNPVSHSNAVVTVNFGKAAVEGEAEIELWNSLGQRCWSKKANVADGQTQMDVQLGNELSGGMYHLIVKQNGTVNNYRIVVQ